MRYLLIRPEDKETIELGAEEYFLCRQLNGKLSFEEIKKRFDEEFHLTLDRDLFEAMIDKLSQEKLFIGNSILVQEAFPNSIDPWAPTKQISFGSPQAILQRLLPLFGWCFSLPFALVSLVLLIPVTYIVYYYGSPFLSIQMRILADFTNFWDILLFAGVSFFLISIPHQFVHGLALVRYGGRVKDCGIRIYLNICPAAYIDFSDFVWVRSKSQRMQIIFAGLFFQLLATEIGFIGWWLTMGWPPFFPLFFLTVGEVGLFAFLVNLTPLTYGDGYLLLAQWLEIPDLRNRVLAAVQSWFPGQSPVIPMTFKERIGFIFCIFLLVPYLLPIYVVMVIAAQYANRFQGIGGVIVVTGAALLLQRPVGAMIEHTAPVRWYKRLLFGKGRGRLIKVWLWSSLLLLMLVPYPYDTGGPIVFFPEQKLEIRPQVVGEIVKVLVKENDFVHQGQTVALLSTRVHQEQLDVQVANLESARSHLQLLQTGATPEAIDKAKQQVETSQVQYDYFRKETDRLRPLFKEGVISEEKFQQVQQERDLNHERLEEAKANLRHVLAGFRPEEIDAAKADVRRLETLVESSRQNMQLTALTSPMDGRITTPYLEDRVGYYLKEGDLFAQVENNNTLQTEVDTPEGNISDVHIGEDVRIKIWTYPYAIFRGKVTSIAPIAIDKGGEKVIRVMVQVPNRDGLLKSNMTGYAKIDAGWKPFGVVLTRVLVRFIMVEVWYWIP
ncbi:MAG TPA: efflux RND transporter periplasmic adaptor subunit [Nitrospiria bacterium]|nr:efflux RND transporter periplasmic adaptor subunit [Nitrospiria bacterium]